MDTSSFVSKYSTNKSIPTVNASANTNTSTKSTAPLATQLTQNKINNSSTSNSNAATLPSSIVAPKTGATSSNSNAVPAINRIIAPNSNVAATNKSTVPMAAGTSADTGANLNQMFNNSAPDGTSIAAYNNRVNQTPLAKYFNQDVGVQNADTSATAATAAAIPAPVTIPTQQITDYLNNYNADRENKIRSLYTGNLDSQNAGLKATLDTNLGQLKTAYDTNLGNLKTAYDNNTGSLKTAYDTNTGTLKTAYDTNIANLTNAYEQNLSNALAARDQISPRYQESMNALGSEYERLRRNNNMQAAVNGLNTGAGSQLALGQSMAYQRNQGNLARSENEALNEAERGINDLGRTYQNQQNILNTEYTNNRASLDQKYANEIDKLNRDYQNQLATYGTTYQNNVANMKTNYENQIAQAAANNNYQLAAALLDEYGSQYDRMQQQAALLAGFGDFSAYADLYGQEAADAMKLNWALQNPQVAWASGNLKAEDYYALTGQYPNDPNAANALGLAGTVYSKYMNTSPTTGYYNGVAQQPQQTQSNDLLPFLSKYNY